MIPTVISNATVAFILHATTQFLILESTSSPQYSRRERETSPQEEPLKELLNGVKFVPRSFLCCVQGTERNASFRDLRHIKKAFKHCQRYLGSDVTNQSYQNILFYSVLARHMDSDCICDQPTKAKNSLYCSFWLLNFLVAFLGNFTVCVLFSINAKLRRNIANMFITSLAASDLMVTIFVIPVRLAKSLYNHYFCMSLRVCRLFYSTDVMFFAASITNLLVVTVDRFVAIQYPYRYEELVTRRRAKATIASTWAYAVIWAIFIHYDPASGGFDAIKINKLICVNKNRSYFFILFVAVWAIPSLIIGILYVKIIKVALRHGNSIASQRRLVKTFTISEYGKETKAEEEIINKNKSSGSNSPSEDAKNDEIMVKGGRNLRGCFNFVRIHTLKPLSEHKVHFQVAKVVFLVFGIFFLCWLPTVAIFFAQLVNAPDLTLEIYAIFVEVLPIFSSTCNPFVYGVFHRDFKQAIVKYYSSAKQRYFDYFSKKEKTRCPTQ